MSNFLKNIYFQFNTFLFTKFEKECFKFLKFHLEKGNPERINLSRYILKDIKPEKNESNNKPDPFLEALEGNPWRIITFLKEKNFLEENLIFKGEYRITEKGIIFIRNNERFSTFLKNLIKLLGFIGGFIYTSEKIINFIKQI